MSKAEIDCYMVTAATLPFPAEEKGELMASRCAGIQGHAAVE